VKIEVFSDIACPWCFVGDRRLERAILERPEVQVERVWHPFQLQPAMPKGTRWAGFAEQKFGGAAQRQAAFERVISAGSSEGIQFDFEAMPFAPNTQDAHRLILWAEAKNLGGQMSERLFRAYFTEAQDVMNLETLTRLGVDVGLERESTLEFLNGEDLRLEVGQSQSKAAQLGVSGVPFYVFGGKYALSGAQPLEVFLRALDLVIEEEKENVV
jgi:predicted DsbA family dithiol-disulfide isomerase